MNGPSKENLNELFEKFLGADESRQAAEDILAGDAILRDYPAPEPDRKLLMKIKFHSGLALYRQKRVRQRHRIISRIASVAAVLAISVFVGFSLWPESSAPKAYTPKLSKAIWDTQDVSEEDPALALFAAEIEQIKDQVQSLQALDSDIPEQSAITELEMELFELDGDFWEG